MFKKVNWHAVFVPETPLLEIFVRGSLVYLGLFLLLRVLLKRESGTLGITDMLLVVLIADAAQNGMAHEYRSVPEGLLLVTTIIFWSWLLNWLGYRFPVFHNLIKSKKLLLVKNGRMIKQNMQRELITTSELMSEVRMSGITDLAEVKEAYMEPSGTISVITYEQSTGKRRDKQIV
ncbi:DUF421 domain-containing protein [Hymenobacter wooponensis]|uniref:DUF421 domain-containing protein n=1 Tax=Hymenobacter wooponensis TaxID=1525360 RepID=A0A4Z0MIS3_9BACT|nr:YetF domain-containing protein [Hymenobacter wooponensis]TGD79643.1 DUF421 domain-containing protein [Hymenobacter wooponensis]